jgi:naphthalene 1,2-dioxygenase system ferredoxin subunit
MTDLIDADGGRWVRVMAAADIPEGSVVAAEIAGHPIAVYHLEGGEFCATDGLCTHGAACLSDGFLDGDVIECPLHGGCFEVRTGKGLGEPIEHDLPTYPVRVKDEDIWVQWRAAAAER